MAHTKQALKRARQSTRRRAEHKSERSAMRSHLKKLNEALKSGPSAEVTAQAVAAQRKLDKAAKHKVMHRNAAARLKSRLAKKINAAKAGKKPS